MSCTCITADPTDVPKGSTPTLLARIEAMSGSASSPVVQADVSEIAYSVRDIDDVSTGSFRETVGGTLTVSSVIFNTLQTGDAWTEDDIGYNFAHQLATTAVDQDDHRFLAQYSILLTDGSIATFEFPINATPVYTTL